MEGPAESISDRSAYGIRALNTAEVEPDYWIDYLNTPFVQDAIGVDLNYTSAASVQVSLDFTTSGDWAYNKLPDLEKLLDRGVRVALIYGDAICDPWPRAGIPASSSKLTLRDAGLPRQLVRRGGRLHRGKLHTFRRVPSGRLCSVCGRLS